MREHLALPALVFEADQGEAIVNGATLPLVGISTEMLPNHGLRLKCMDAPRGLPFEGHIDIRFTTPAGWNVTASECRVMHAQSACPPGSLTATLDTDILTARRGTIDVNDQVTLYKVVADFPFAHYYAVLEQATFAHPALQGLTLVALPPDHVPTATGYFTLQDTLNSIDSSWVQTFDHMYWLLSLAAANHISFPVTYIKGADGEELRLIKTIDPRPGEHRLCVPLGRPAVVAAFLNSTWDHYIRFLHQFDLTRLIDYYIEMRSAAPTEITYLIGSVFMETLKYSYATTVKHYKRKSHTFYKSDNSPYTFGEAINDIYHHFGITRGLSAEDIVKHRNEVVHEGRFISPFPDMLTTLQSLETTIEHLLLKMLNYDGPYRDRSGRSYDSFKYVVV